MDAFEARLQFTNRLSKLGASSQAAKSCAQFALKHREFHEDLHSCIMEQLDSVPMNTRVNLLYFIEILCETGNQNGFSNYTDMVRQDLATIIERVVPSTGTGAANIGTVRRVVLSLLEKSIIDHSLKIIVDDILTEREKESEIIEVTIDEPEQEQRLWDEKSIYQRMNEDRERHKRLRENIWAIPSPSAENTDPEYNMCWDNTSDQQNDDNLEIMKEEDNLRTGCSLE